MFLKYLTMEGSGAKGTGIGWKRCIGTLHEGDIGSGEPGYFPPLKRSILITSYSPYW